MPIDWTKPTCIRCGMRNSALPMATCIPCYGAVRGEQELVGTTEIAERLGVSTDTVRKWGMRHTSFPRPLLTLAMGQIWRWEDVQAWANANERAR